MAQHNAAVAAILAQINEHEQAIAALKAALALLGGVVDATAPVAQPATSTATVKAAAKTAPAAAGITWIKRTNKKGRESYQAACLCTKPTRAMAMVTLNSGKTGWQCNGCGQVVAARDVETPSAAERDTTQRVSVKAQGGTAPTAGGALKGAEAVAAGLCWRGDGNPKLEKGNLCQACRDAKDAASK